MKLRKMVRKDLKKVVALESKTTQFALNEEEASSYLTSASITAYIVEVDQQIVGFTFFATKNDKYVIHRLVVNAEHRKKLIATLLMNRIKAEVDKSNGRNLIEYIIRETNLGGQLFLKRHGFKAIEIMKDYWGNEDGYRMTWSKE